MAHTRAQRLSRSVAMGAMLVVGTAGSTMAEPGTDELPEAGVAITSMVDAGTEWTLADIYAGYADAERGERPEADVATTSAVDGRAEWSLADIYAGYADADAGDAAH